jgi:hypothetical protein
MRWVERDADGCGGQSLPGMVCRAVLSRKKVETQNTQKAQIIAESPVGAVSG